jgi:hypothetical protein
LLAVLADVIIIDLILLAPCSYYATELSYTSWSLVSEYYLAEVKAIVIVLVISIRVVGKSLLVTLTFLGRCERWFPSRFPPRVSCFVHDIFKR